MSVYNYIVIAFSASELCLLAFKRSKTGLKQNNADKRSLLYLWITIPACLTLAGFISGYRLGPVITGDAVTKIGFAIAIAGFAIRWTAIFALGKFFTVDVEISDEHKLKTGGIYKMVRHPSYLGLILIIAALGLCTENLVSLAVIIIPIFVAMDYRITVEEKALTEAFGTEYTAYRKRTSKIIPWIY
jgi:protein-S-isoprenylcysteine O-methyltransferase Ste14